jgi:hypothetical protein
MPTVHYFSRETLRKHGIDPLQWEVTHSKKQRATTTNDSVVANVNAEVDDGIRVNAAGTSVAKSGVHQPPYKSTGMDDNNIDAEDQSHDGKGIHQDDDECPNKPSEQKVHKAKKKSSTDFFGRVDELKAYKEKNGHIKVRYKEDPNLYCFCNNVRSSRRAITAGKGKIHYRLDEIQIAALDAIGFNWDPQGLNLSSTLPSAVTSKSTQQATNPNINVGDVGYQFRKEFDSGWYNGTVVEILPHALGGLDRRCVYEDGDCEDLALSELKRLVTLSSNVGAIEVEEDMKPVEDGGMKVAATEWVSIPAVKEMAVVNVKEEECHKSSNQNVDNPKLKQNINFFDRVDELKAYKEKHGHLNVSHKEEKGLYHFCINVRQARKGKKGCFRLDDGRIATLDAIGFKWEVEASTAAFRDDSFFARVDKLKAYKGKHGHLNIQQNENESLYRFCIDVRRARKAKITGKGKIHYTLDETRIAALDAIGFDWKLGAGTSTTAATKDDNFFTQVDKLRAYKEEHGHLNVQKKEDQRLYHFCYNMRQSRRAITAGKGKIHYRLDDDRMTALDAIGFEWI